MHFAKEGYSDCFYDLSYALEMAQANGEFRFSINVENCDEEALRMAMNFAKGLEKGKGEEKGKGKEKGKGRVKGKGKKKGEAAIYARAEGRSEGKGKRGSVAANHRRFSEVLGLGSDEEQYIKAMRKYPAPKTRPR